MTRGRRDIAAGYRQVAGTVVGSTSRRVIFSTRQRATPGADRTPQLTGVVSLRINEARHRPATHPKIHNRSSVSADVWPGLLLRPPIRVQCIVDQRVARPHWSRKSAVIF